MICKKCASPMAVILRKKDHYCENCFILSTNHKFRACIGKNKVLSPNENVLICLSGGVGSAVLLDLVHHGISLENNKKLRIVPHFIHLFDDNVPEVSDAILKKCQKYNFDIYFVHLSDYLNNNTQLPEVNQIVALKEDDKIKFTRLLNCMPSTAANDYLLKVKRHLFIKYAKQLNCSAIFTAETTNTLAINLLCNLAIGRGSQVQNDVGFCDVRDEKVKILRPMKDISKEELDYYVKIKKLVSITRTNVKSNSLQSAISSFVSDLQQNFQSTISTVCKTADKIGDYEEDKASGKCVICKVKHFKVLFYSNTQKKNLNNSM
ncbi:unnamed protein product [Chrysodeixis includens]|uniref:Cytoplasmic tRNA 2-thiolation protein 2 n=1 Tax=Chrysodeixis includens TaxID=689277 RepID=A0A9P0BR10_CHRIL|nr:unnamed protein product [Chrysodeixis includens]